MQLKTHLPLLAFILFFAVSFNKAGAATHEALKTLVPLETPTITPSPEYLKTKSFREWKSERVQDALIQVTATRTKIQLVKSKDPNLVRRKGALEANSGVNTEALETQLQQDQSTLEMAKDLSVTDYFVGYLTKLQDRKAAFNEVAGKLTAGEVAELMAAYANSVFGGHSSELAPSANDFSSDRVK
jgi:hypothetical protein